ncbi:MAG TPA: hypothetical protein VLB86_10455 [Gaiellaceae bacterium]|nr:hypothetical protein [Gaiellaceae bacterium]
MRRLALVLAAALGAAVLVPAAGAEVAVNLKVPLEDFVVEVPCANGGAGDVFELHGDLHVLIAETTSASGGIVSVAHFQPMGVYGIGTSGTVYRGTGVNQGVDTFTGGAIGSTFINNFRIIGAGPGNNLLVHDTIHVTLDANGVVRATVEISSVDCR